MAQAVAELQGRLAQMSETQAAAQAVLAERLQTQERVLSRNLEDLSWLEKVARGHDTVIHAVAGAAATAPLRLATICLDDDGVRARLDEWHDALETALDRVEGRAEWAVKAYARSDAPSSAEAPV